MSIVLGGGVTRTRRLRSLIKSGRKARQEMQIIMGTPYTDHDNVINVVLHQNQFSEDENSYYGRVTRNTVTLEQLIRGILDDNENTSTGLNAYILNFAMDRMKARVIAEIKAGNAVSLLGLGTAYLALKGSFTVDTDNLDVSALKGKGLSVAFCPSADMQSAVSQLKVGSISLGLRAPSINAVVNLATKSTDRKLSLGKCAELQGNRLKVSGGGSGVFFVPVDETGKTAGDESQWVRIPDDSIVKNYPKSLIFQVPDTLGTETRYVLAVRTLYVGGNASLKSPVTGFSPVVEVGA